MRWSFRLKMMTVLLLAIAVGACGTGAPSTVGSKSPPFKPSSDARKDLGDSLRKLSTAFPYRLTETTTTSSAGQSDAQQTRVVEFAAADRFHVKLSGGQGEDLEMITIGDKGYTKENGKWSEEPANSRRPTKSELEKDLADAIKDVSLVGPEKVNGIECFAYNYTIQFDAVKGSGKTWLRASDGLPLQSDSEFKAETYESKSHVIYEYNADVKIEPPK